MKIMGQIAERIRFETHVHRPAEGGDWLFLRLPIDASERLPTRSMCSVEGTFHGHPFWTTLRPDGEGGHWMRIEPALIAETHVHAGQAVELEIQPMAEEPEPEVPDDLKAALAQTPQAMAAWTGTTALARRDWIFWMTSGKKAETRGIRLEKMMDMLGQGKRRICCFDRSGMYDKSQSCPKAAPESS